MEAWILICMVRAKSCDRKTCFLSGFFNRKFFLFWLFVGRKCGDRNVLDWAARYRIAVGAARGISYLHHDCIPHIIHRDIKSSNILLDHNMEPRVSDFGLATLMEPDKTHVSTFVAGTFGYLAPGLYNK